MSGQDFCNLLAMPNFLKLQTLFPILFWPIYTPGIQSMQWGYIVFVFSVCLYVSLSVNIYFVSKISQELLNLET